MTPTQEKILDMIEEKPRLRKEIFHEINRAWSCVESSLKYLIDIGEVIAVPAGDRDTRTKKQGRKVMLYCINPNRDDHEIPLPRCTKTTWEHSKTKHLQNIWKN